MADELPTGAFSGRPIGVSGSVVELVLFDSVLFEQGRMIDRWAFRLKTNFKRHAIEAAPINKRQQKSHLSDLPVGSLKAGIDAESHKVGPKHYQITVSSSAPYSIFVLMGTPRSIFPRTSNKLRLPYNVGFSPAHATIGKESQVPFVSGQRPQNFLAVAAGRTAFTNRSLRGFEHVIGQQF
jgi:hypothetical protein